jgi:hypothetical protein
MPKIGVTGHIHLTESTSALVYRRITDALRPLAGAGLHGVTCLANGADQLFARAVDALDGTFDVVLPAIDYRQRVVDRDDRPAFDELLDRAVSVFYMPFYTSGPDAYLAASEEMLRRVEQVLAVWDGQPSDRAGGTADVVRMAHDRGLPVKVLWPAGARRRQPVAAGRQQPVAARRH